MYCAVAGDNGLVSVDPATGSMAHTIHTKVPSADASGEDGCRVTTDACNVRTDDPDVSADGSRLQSPMHPLPPGFRPQGPRLPLHPWHPPLPSAAGACVCCIISPKLLKKEHTGAKPVDVNPGSLPLQPPSVLQRFAIPARTQSISAVPALFLSISRPC